MLKSNKDAKFLIYLEHCILAKFVIQRRIFAMKSKVYFVIFDCDALITSIIFYTVLLLSVGIFLGRAFSSFHLLPV